MQFEMSVEMFPPAVGLAAALVSAVQEWRVAGGLGWPSVVSVGVERVEDGHRDGAVGVALVSLLIVVRQTLSAAGTVEVSLVSHQVLLPLEIFPALRAPEGPLRLLAQVSHLRGGFRGGEKSFLMLTL